MAKKLGENGLLIVSMIIILLGFFSSSISFTGQHHIGGAGVGISNHYAERFDCSHVDLVRNYIQAGTTNLALDANYDGILDFRDYDIIKAQAVQVPCGYPHECSVTTCRYGTMLEKCVEDKDYWRVGPNGYPEPLRVIEEIKCPGGQTCREGVRGTIECTERFH